ncbi:hypothetical protein M9979_03385 [Sphingomonas sp. RP10(2022)]|uniref:Sulfur globule protein n=1 Tax=Sphingomonas liriopis TaxID=2949094 RepID=A0A9X2HR36_9SPHN|nr:hypothetical protein [Sphingomonas liriopis]MCP3733919.1 hypothetical protein [Sphingomonas liriopis]
MKLIALFGAVALAAGTVVTAAPAEAQRGPDRGWHGHRGPGWDRGPGWNRGPRWDHGRRWDRRGPRWHGGYGYRGGYGRPGYGYGRGRVVCRMERGYYGPVRRCFRVYR